MSNLDVAARCALEYLRQAVQTDTGALRAVWALCSVVRVTVGDGIRAQASTELKPGWLVLS